jgi:hypothetical protein
LAARGNVHKEWTGLLKQRNELLDDRGADALEKVGCLLNRLAERGSHDLL